MTLTPFAPQCRRAFRVMLTTSVSALALLVNAGCATLPPLAVGRLSSVALPDSTPTPLREALTPSLVAHPGESGNLLLVRPIDAFAARAVLAATASHTLDVQYYIWHDDRTGHLLLESLLEAADRGVRVRLLLDDLPTTGLDATIAAVDAHPNIEVRLYNPYANRGLRFLDYVMDFRRIQRRMHAKSITADNALSVVGGRNIGDEYFGLSSNLLFADLDVLSAGPVVAQVSQQFDLHWNSRSAYEASQLIRPAPAGALDSLRAKMARIRSEPASRAYIEAVAATPLMSNLLGEHARLHWAPTTLVFDDPAKTRTSSPRRDVLLSDDLSRVVGRPTISLDLVSPYFVPGRDGTESFAALEREGVRVRVLTNSLASTDVAAVHAGYVKSRKKLLRAGVELFEFHPTASREHFASRRSRAPLALHSKTFAVDSARLFVGSFNFDPRSTHYNTELGIVIESRALAQGLHDDFARDVPRSAYQVQIGEAGRGLEWVEQTASGSVRYTDEPGASVWRRFLVSVVRWLPVDWLM